MWIYQQLRPPGNSKQKEESERERLVGARVCFRSEFQSLFTETVNHSLRLQSAARFRRHRTQEFREVAGAKAIVSFFLGGPEGCGYRYRAYAQPYKPSHHLRVRHVVSRARFLCHRCSANRAADSVAAFVSAEPRNWKPLMCVPALRAPWNARYGAPWNLMRNGQDSQHCRDCNARRTGAGARHALQPQRPVTLGKTFTTSATVAFPELVVMVSAPLCSRVADGRNLILISQLPPAANSAPQLAS
jgi:hypothetical protein